MHAIVSVKERLHKDTIHTAHPHFSRHGHKVERLVAGKVYIANVMQEMKGADRQGRMINYTNKNDHSNR